MSACSKSSNENLSQPQGDDDAAVSTNNSTADASSDSQNAVSDSSDSAVTAAGDAGDGGPSAPARLTEWVELDPDTGRLVLSGKTFRFAGSNVVDLGWDGTNVSRDVTTGVDGCTDDYDDILVDDALVTAKENGRDGHAFVRRDDGRMFALHPPHPRRVQ
jgi:hypothetical protein